MVFQSTSRALLCLFLSVGPAAVLSAPYPPQRASSGLSARGFPSSSSEESGSNMNAGIPGGRQYSQNNYYSNKESSGSDESSSHDKGETKAGDNWSAGIPGGPEFNMGSYSDQSYKEEKPTKIPHPIETPVWTPPPVVETHPPVPAPPASSPPAETCTDTPTPTPTPEYTPTPTPEYTPTPTPEYTPTPTPEYTPTPTPEHTPTPTPEYTPTPVYVPEHTPEASPEPPCGCTVEKHLVIEKHVKNADNVDIVPPEVHHHTEHEHQQTEAAIGDDIKASVDSVDGKVTNEWAKITK